MVFKLVRTDCEGPNKIQLPVGTHLIGRGKFLDCEDKRISRNHGNLIVDDNSVAIEALHQNPCFWTKKGSTEVKILKKATKETLQNGDRFGLLPASFWYEVLYVPESDSQATDVSYTQEYSNGNTNTTNNNDLKGNDDLENKTNDETIQDSYVNPAVDEGEKHEEFLDFDLNETVEDVARPESPSLLDQENQSEPPINEPANTHEPNQSAHQPESNEITHEPEPNPDIVQEAEIADEPTSSIKTEPKSPSPKRSHSPGSQGAKKIKVEPEVKQDRDSVAGPSNDQEGGPKPVDDGNKAPQPPPAARRERCLYGASCYRKNPQHKAEFSHPSDPDWGTEPRAPCPYGAACRKRDPRHYDLHDHPGRARPPPPPVQRQRKPKKTSDTDDSDSEVPSQSLVVNGKRKRKPLFKQIDPSDSENEDPFASDGSEDWQPPSDYTESQDYY